jgi:hypothetical protein
VLRRVPRLEADSVIDGDVAMLTETEALALIRKALTLHDAERPVPSHVSVAEAAEMLGVTTRTIARMKPQRNKAGKIPYRWIVETMAAR